MKSAIRVLTATLMAVPLAQAQSVDATQFCGGTSQPLCTVDACTKIRAAATYALTNKINLVDATHFYGSQSCSVDPIGGLNATVGAPLNLTINFGSVHFLSTVPWTITNSALALHGAGSTSTILEYTGATTSTNVLYAHAQSGVSNGLEEIDIRDMFFLGNPTYTTDTLLLQDVNRSTLMNVNVWGASNCALHQEGAVDTTLYRVKESQREYQNIDPGGTAATANGWCPDKSSVSENQTTNGTVIDNAVEYVTGIGWNILSAQTMKISGTSEHNAKGLVIASGAYNKFLTFLGIDIELNTAGVQGVDIDDLGQNNVYINTIANSGCTSCSSVFAGGGGGQQIIGDAGLGTNSAGPFNVWGNSSNLNNDGGAYVINGRTEFASTSIYTAIVNAPGVQIVTASNCSITAGAIGNTCNITFTFASEGGANEPDTLYNVICTPQNGGAGITAIGSVGSKTTTGFVVPLVALSSTATGTGGTTTCSVFHE